MPSPRRLLLVAAAVAAAALAGCDLGDDGPQTTQTRDVAGFTRIDNSASVDVRLHVGEPQRVRVLAGEKVIDDVGTEVRDDTLHVTFLDARRLRRQRRRRRGRLCQSSRASRPTGSGDIDADGIDADAFDLRSDGSADIALAGTGGLALELQAGRRRSRRPCAGVARVMVGGSGDAHVRADDRLDVTVDGSGDVRYHGYLAVTQHVDGSGHRAAQIIRRAAISARADGRGERTPDLLGAIQALSQSNP